MVMQSLLGSRGDLDLFKRDLARRLKFWLLGIPAGVGLATLKSIFKLIVGFSPDNSGIYSAGNGPAMRSAIFGLYAGKDVTKLKTLVRISTHVTHTDPKAEDGALAIALAAQYAARRAVEQFEMQEFFTVLRDNLLNIDLLEMLAAVEMGLGQNLSSVQMADSFGFEKGVSGYIVHTVPMAIFCWLKNINNFRNAIEDVILLGGDTDTMGAIVGALAGATLGANQIPKEWQSGIKDFPFSVNMMRKLSMQLSTQVIENSTIINGDLLSLYFLSRIPRNIFFTIVILLHGLRRLFPPY
jgi:ADP-ribosylglycohydrolase